MLKYPILFVHGMGFRDRKIINYWGRIPKIFIDDGNKVFYGGQDSNGTVEDNAQILKERIEKIIEETGEERLNIIAHSKGGMDIRYAICQLEADKFAASLTTVNTPHNGSKTIDKILGLPQLPIKLGSRCTDLWMKLLGDKNPHTYDTLKEFSTVYAHQFNIENPDKPDIYYQSYACVMNKSRGDIFMMIPHIVVNALEGENDGFLTPEGVKHGEFKGIIRSNSNRGISHCDEVDMRRHRLTKKTGEGISDILEMYREILQTLKDRGL